MLQSYLNDLKTAQNQGRNLLTEKYARMDNLIKPLKNNPLIEKIVAIETKWQAEILELYPALYGVVCRSTDPASDGSNFSVYQRCELETYGDQTIALYYQQVQSAAENKDNLAMRMLLQLVKKGGFEDLNQAETYFYPQQGRQQQTLQ
jgi:hypothetical protein